jgi:tetratricopeptide (TPR) repeat protein
LRVFAGAGEGLAAAHQAGIVHRDFKPDNVLMGRDGRPRVTDFGLARAPRHAPEPAAPLPPAQLPLAPSTLTPLGALLGTPAYMAPEQLEGAAASPASDVFAFCTVLFMALYGERPFEGDTLGAIRDAIKAGRVREPPRGRRMPDWLHKLVVSGLRADPAARPSLTSVIAGLRSHEVRRRRRTAAVAAVGVAALAVCAVMLLERAGSLVSLRRLMPRERQVTAWLTRASSEYRAHGAVAQRDVLQEAAAAVPGNPRVLLDLAGSLFTMRAEAQANEVIARAWLRRDELTSDEQARLEILRLQSQRDFDGAVARARARWQEAPGDVDRGVLVGSILAATNKSKDLLVVLDALHQLPPPAGTDPRIDSLEVRPAREVGDMPRSLAAARRAYQGFSDRGERPGMSRARWAEGITLQRLGSDPAAIQQAFSQAVALAREAHDDPDLALADISLSQARSLAGDLAGARPPLEEALAIHQRTGNTYNQGIALLNLSNLLRRQRDLPGAIERMTAAQTTFLELGDRRQAATAQGALGMLRTELGDLVGASSALEQALAVQREIKEQVGLADSLVALTQVRLMQGDIAQARKLLAEARAIPKPTRRSMVEFSWLEASIEFASGAWAQAAAAASAAARDAGEAKFVDEQAEAEALLARTLIEAGKPGPAREAVTRGQAALSGSKSNVARVALAVADGLLLAREDPRHPDRAGQILEAALALASSNGVAIDRWEARLALAKVRARGEGGAAGLQELAQQARAQGFGLYARSAEAALASR